MRRKRVLAIVIAVFATASFFVFVPVIHDTYAAPCYSPCSNGVPAGVLVQFNYSASISFQYFRVGSIYGACGGYLLIDARTNSPAFCETPKT